MTIQNKRGPFSFDEILKAKEHGKSQAPAATLSATDGVELVIHVYRPEAVKPAGALLFYHGGGAHSLAGYQHIGRGLSQKYNMSVYMPDLRGHGLSGGPRGDSPSTEQVFQDISSTLEYISEEETALPQNKIFLGGHSSGGGLVINYSTWSKRRNVAGYVLVSPELGYLSKTARPGRQDFAKVAILPFVLNGIFGILGHSKAVKFQYPDSALRDDGVIGYNTVNMANAITPTSPPEQFSKIDRPIGLWIGSDDELFVSEAVVEYTKRVQVPGTCGIVIPGKNHLGILVGVYEFIGPWVTDRLEENK